MTLIASGIHSVKSILFSPFFTFQKAVLSLEHKNNQELIAILKKKSVNYEFQPSVFFANNRFSERTQGLVLFIKRYFYTPLEKMIAEVLKNNQKKKVIILLDGIEDPHNFGAITRTAAALGILGIIIENKKQVPVNNTVIKVSSGGIAFVPISQVNSLENAIKELKKNNFRIISTVCESNSSVNVFEERITFVEPVCLIFGNEHKGVRSSFQKKSDFNFTIPLKNKMNSFNVSVSCGIICS